MNKETFSFSLFFSGLPPLSHKSWFSRSETLKKIWGVYKKGRYEFFFSISDLKNSIFDSKGAKMKKMTKMKKFLYWMEKLFHFVHFFNFFPRLNRKTRFSRSEILKTLISALLKIHLTCYTGYRFYNFLQYGLMDLVIFFLNGAWYITLTENHKRAN